MGRDLLRKIHGTLSSIQGLALMMPDAWWMMWMGVSQFIEYEIIILPYIKRRSVPYNQPAETWNCCHSMIIKDETTIQYTDIYIYTQPTLTTRTVFTWIHSTTHSLSHFTQHCSCCTVHSTINILDNWVMFCWANMTWDAGPKRMVACTGCYPWFPIGCYKIENAERKVRWFIDPSVSICKCKFIN